MGETRPFSRKWEKSELRFWGEIMYMKEFNSYSCAIVNLDFLIWGYDEGEKKVEEKKLKNKIL